LVFALSGLLLPLLLGEFADWCPRLAERLVRWSARRLTDPGDRDRYLEEYLANLRQVPGNLSQLLAAVGYAANVLAMRRTLGAAGRMPAGLEPLAAVHRSRRPGADVHMLQRAYSLAEETHRGETRRSGEEFITHPVAVATILGEHGLDTMTLAAALLHDSSYGGRCTPDTVRRKLDPEVARLVAGVSTLDRFRTATVVDAERSLIELTGDPRADPRILLIKLADRLHNLRTIRYVAPETQERTARQTLDVLAPIAARLGIDALRRELVELATAVLDPTRPTPTDTATAAAAAAAAEQLAALLRPALRSVTVIVGPDSPRSLRVLTESLADCSIALDLIHRGWRPARPVDVQVCTAAAHHAAEYGVAARWASGKTSAAYPQ
jgi:GTP pyrophosphokinase